MRMAGRFFLFFFLGQNGLEHVTWLGDMRKVDFRRYRLLCSPRRVTCMAG
jgi:hypothetical protein